MLRVCVSATSHQRASYQPHWAPKARARTLKGMHLCARTQVFTIQFVREFTKLGLTRSVGGVMALALSRELTPVVTAIILAGRVGSAFAAELGTMQVRGAGVQGGPGGAEGQVMQECR